MTGEPPAKPQPEAAGASGSQYALKQDYIAATRLNSQHYVWKNELGFNIHPTIEVPEKARIAEVAMGTAIWTLEVAQEHPTAHIDAFDISYTQAPPQAWMPESVKFHKWDMMEKPPTEFEGKFDLVHLRLVVLAFDDNADALMSNLFKLLKPGGYLQWDEGDFQNLAHLHPNIAEATELAEQAPATAKIRSMMIERTNKDWIVRLPEKLEEHGFIDARRDCYPVRRNMLKYGMDTLLIAWDEIVSRLPDTVPGGKTMIIQLLAGMKAEAANGHVIATRKAVTVAKKPE